VKKSKDSEWEVHPEIVKIKIIPKTGTAIWRRMVTKHEGSIVYLKYWNFWVRAGVRADQRSVFFRDYERSDANADTLLGDVSGSRRRTRAQTEEEIWSRIGMVWNWLRENVISDLDEYESISSVIGEWPSILDYGRYYVNHGNLVWYGCFSKAHLFAILLGRIVASRFRFGIASARHTHAGAPPTATHVYVAAYVSDRWFYFDPGAVYSKQFPDFNQRQSIGVDSLETVDYEHPYTLKPLPLSGFNRVPYLPQ
jgi:hypothetical protein